MSPLLAGECRGWYDVPHTGTLLCVCVHVACTSTLQILPTVLWWQSRVWLGLD